MESGSWGYERERLPDLLASPFTSAIPTEDIVQDKQQTISDPARESR